MLSIGGRVSKHHCLHPMSSCLQALAVCLTDLLLSNTLFPSKSGNDGVVDQSAYCAFGLREVAMADLHARSLRITCHLLDPGVSAARLYFTQHARPQCPLCLARHAQHSLPEEEGCPNPMPYIVLLGEQCNLRTYERPLVLWARKLTLVCIIQCMTPKSM